MGFNGTEAEPITLAEASEMTGNYRTANPGAVKAYFFGKDILNQILEQGGCMGLRVYYAADNTGNPQMIVVGADANENDQEQGVIAERAVPCPPYCGWPNGLNGD